MAYRNLAVLDAAERAAQQLNELIDRAPPRRLLHVSQMRESMQSIAANISEGFGRGAGGGTGPARSRSPAGRPRRPSAT